MIERELSERELPEEVPVAIVCDGITLAVLMCTPVDLVDFARGFLLTEGIVERGGGIGTGARSGAGTLLPDVEILEHANGIECRVRLGPASRLAIERRRRSLAATSSCGLCGVKSLAQAVRAPASVAGKGFRLRTADARAAVDALRLHQPLHDRTRGVHAAGFFVPGRGMTHVREDVGRHNALDKLAGALAGARRDADAGTGAKAATDGAVVLTSRVSIEMVQKAAAVGAPVLVAVSTPTALAVRAARAAGLTLIGNARNGRQDVFTHPFRVPGEPGGARAEREYAANERANRPPREESGGHADAAHVRSRGVPRVHAEITR